jgi:protein-S-isoprenylcysteine O-methyltransferase Ste14
MISAQQITTLCWIIFLIYWLVSARSVKPTKEQTRGIGGYWHYVLLVVAFVLLQKVPVYPLTIPLLPHSSFAVGILSSVCALLGLGIAIVARRTLAGNWSGSVTFKEDHSLITTGIYRYMRHPIYTGVLLMFIGTALLVGTLGALVGFLIAFLTLWFKLKQEEDLMKRHFPRDYPAYTERVKVLIPYIF